MVEHVLCACPFSFKLIASRLVNYHQDPRVRMYPRSIYGPDRAGQGRTAQTLSTHTFSVLVGHLRNSCSCLHRLSLQKSQTELKVPSLPLQLSPRDTRLAPRERPWGAAGRRRGRARRRACVRGPRGSRPLTTYHLDDLGLLTRLLLHGEDVLRQHHPAHQRAHAGTRHRSHLGHGGPVHDSSSRGAGSRCGEARLRPSVWAKDQDLGESPLTDRRVGNDGAARAPPSRPLAGRTMPQGKGGGKGWTHGWSWAPREQEVSVRGLKKKKNKSPNA